MVRDSFRLSPSLLQNLKFPFPRVRSIFGQEIKIDKVLNSVHSFVLYILVVVHVLILRPLIFLFTLDLEQIQFCILPS